MPPGQSDPLQGHDTLFLSGGGLKTVAFLGVLAGVGTSQFTRYYGVSAGAALAALLFAGYGAEELLEMVRSEDWAAALRGAFSFARLARGAPLDRRLIRRVLSTWLAAKGVQGAQPMGSLGRRGLAFGCFAVDLETGTLRLFSPETTPHVPLVDALVASMAIPMCFAPVTIDGRQYVDAGVVNNVPLSRCPLPEGSSMLALTISLATPDFGRCKLLVVPWLRSNFMGLAEAACFRRGQVLEMPEAPGDAHTFRISDDAFATLVFQGRLAAAGRRHPAPWLGLTALVVARLLAPWPRRRGMKCIRLHG